MTRDEILADVKRRIEDNRLMLFMKGTPEHPMCGFSSATADILKLLGKPFESKNVLEEPEYRYVLAEHSNWATIPQLFLNGQLVGGCDIVHELYKTGELKKKIDAAFSDA